MEDNESPASYYDRPIGPPTSSPFAPPSGPRFHPPIGWSAPTPPPPRKRRGRRAAAVAAFALIVGAGVALGIETRSNSGSATETTVTTPNTSGTTNTSGTPNTSGSSSDGSTPASTTPSSNEPLPTIATSPTPTKSLDTDAIAALLNPAIVDITTTIEEGEAAGTGMVLTSSGLVLTNNHVIDGATSIEVQIGGTGATHKAHIVGYDVSQDVALIQIEGVSGLKTITAGDSSAAAVGDAVVAIGNALGAPGPHAVTTGEIDALDQTITANDLTGSSESLSGLIQFDAAIQPGDSGGALVNSSGQVIGMNTAASVSGRRRFNDNSTAGYAIPIATALDVAQQIESGEGSATVHIGERAILGIEVTADSAAGGQGVLVAGVRSGGPADGAGIEQGSTITGIDSANIVTLDDLDAALNPHSPGDKIDVAWTDAAGSAHTATLQLIAGPPA